MAEASLSDIVDATLRPGVHAIHDGTSAARLAPLDQIARRRFDAPFEALSIDDREAMIAEVLADSSSELADALRSRIQQLAGAALTDPHLWADVGFRPLPLGVRWPEPLHSTAPIATALHDAADDYDVLIIGSGAGGGVAAHVYTRAGLRVLLVDRGASLTAAQLPIDHLRSARTFLGFPRQVDLPVAGNPRFIDDDLVTSDQFLWNNNAITVGGGTRVYGAQAWRFTHEDFAMGSTYGPEFPDWPISYGDLEPYYDAVEWEMGAAGTAGAHCYDEKRRRAYPLPPFAPTRSQQIIEHGADRLGLRAGPVPLLINTRERSGRAACVRCGTCAGYACPVDAKAGTHNTVIVTALATGLCDLVDDTVATRLLIDGGRVTGAVLTSAGIIRDIRARHTVVACGAIETARLLQVSSVGNEFVGRYLQGHIYTGAAGLFSDVVQDSVGPGASVATAEYRHHNAGLQGGGILANEFVAAPMEGWSKLANAGLIRRFGRHVADDFRHAYPRHAFIVGPVHEMPVATSRVSLHPSVRDRHGMPAVRMHGERPPGNDLKISSFLADRASEWLRASGAHTVKTLDWSHPRGPSANQHQAGTCRIGKSPADSACDEWGVPWGWLGVSVADSSLHVTNGGVNPVLTTMALSWRASEHLASTLTAH